MLVVGALVTQRLLATAAYQEAHTVSVFLSTTTEIDTDGIVQAALAAGKRLFVPLLTDGRMEMVAVHDVEDIAAFPTNRWNIREPPLEPPRERGARRAKSACERRAHMVALIAYDKAGLDLIVMPGMFFDKSGRRLGYGKGCVRFWRISLRSSRRVRQVL